jgi:PIN domain nuclease of toxin-antitoxin system
MRLLLDTHAFLWWLGDDPSLSAAAEAAIGDPDAVVQVSAATVWEITTKYRLGKLPGAATVAADVEAEIEAEGFLPLAITVAHAQLAGSLQGRHKDPFDRMLIAQALAKGTPLVSNEQLFDHYGVSRIW